MEAHDCMWRSSPVSYWNWRMMLRGRKQGGEELWPLPGKSPAMLRVHNISKKVHSGADIFPPFFLSGIQKQHIQSVSEVMGLNRMWARHFATISIGLQTSSAAKNNKWSSQVNSLTAAGFAQQPNNTCFPHLHYSTTPLPEIKNIHPARLS